jgi:hypothetical protein
MPAPTRTPVSRPPGAPAYYLGRPATWWLTNLRPSYQPRTSPAPAHQAAG